jgi:hypothetical protein
MQLQPAPIFHRIVSNSEICSSWNWLLIYLTCRPTTNHPNHCCIYDQKRWGNTLILNPLLSTDSIAIENIARLFIASQLMGGICDILPLASGNFSVDIGIYTNRIEDSIKNVVKSSKRFRHALSEHLAFWAQYAFAVQSGVFNCFSLTPPNFLPEDKGPDGLLMAVRNDSRTIIELRSVKSSIRNPRNMVASGQFRRNGTNPIPSKQLDEFSLISQGKIGFIRLDRLVSNACHELGLPSDQKIRSTLLINNKSFNAMVVADDQHADYDTFSCYHFVSPNPQECVATYVGSDNWMQVAEYTRVEVLHLFRQARVW